MKAVVFKFSFLLLVLFVSPVVLASFDAVVENVGPSDNYIGKRKRNSGSMASKKAMSRQSKRARASIKRNEKRNKQQLRYRTKKQRKQKRFSSHDCFR
ncbi:MAG: hypothetical protein K0R65_2468 [Crocinitomicaceae bacterium]|jgi:hypothetical protein|nr:hypothetical protein [Crocinitomicaceae bacterium]